MVFMKRWINHLLLTVFCLTSLPVMASESTELTKLQAEMLRLISTDEIEQFTKVTEQLKEESKKQGAERIFYKAWGNQAIFEATHQNYAKAEEIASMIEQYAIDQNSFWGNYVALHTKANISLQRQDYQAAEDGFLKAVAFFHKYFPNESAGDDLQELMKIANHRKDQKAGLKYARQILAEPNVAPIHKGRALFRISQFAFNKNNKELYDSIYNVLMELKKTDGIGTVEPVVEVNYHILNGNYDEAMRLCKNLSPDKQAERMAVIYHRMGKDKEAYEQMVRFKKINDSIVLVSHGNVVASCYVQMNNERMKLEQKLLEGEYGKLKRLLSYTVAIAIVIIFILIIWQRHQRVKLLEKKLAESDKALQKAEEAFDMKNEFITSITNELRQPLSPIAGFSDMLGSREYDISPDEREQLSTIIKDNSKTITKLIDEMSELAYYESKKSLPMNYLWSPNYLCRYMVDSLRPLCKEGVRMFFETELEDNYEIKTNEEAVKALLSHLIHNALQYTDKGVITVKCSDFESNVRVSVTDTGKGIPEERREHVFDTFREMGDNQKLQGMGLSICRAIVKLLGGKIWLDESYTDGSRFIFDIPRNR